jgi:UDP-N-acetylglucosamine 3-dehydrogenase
MVRVGLVGAGGIGRVHASCYARVPQSKLVAIADINRLAAEKVAQEHTGGEARIHDSLFALLNNDEVDAVDICLPTYLHEWAVCAAAAAGKHILVEKPVSLLPEQAARMVAAVESAGAHAMVAQVIRFWSQYCIIKERLEAGTLGRPLSANAARLGRAPSTGRKWFSDPILSGGALLDLHIHDLDWLYYLFGLPKTVYAVGHRSQRGGWDHVLSTLDYGDMKATVEASFFMPDSFPFGMIFRLLGTDGFAEYRYAGSQGDPRLTSMGMFAVYPNGGQPEFPEAPSSDPYLTEVRYFIECLDRGEAPTIATLREAQEVLEIAGTVRRSLQSGQVVAVPHANGA